MENNNSYSDSNRSPSNEKVSSTKKLIPNKSDASRQDETRPLHSANINQTDAEESDPSDEVMRRSQRTHKETTLLESETNQQHVSKANTPSKTDVSKKQGQKNHNTRATAIGHADGMKRFLDGITYQQQLMVAILCHASELFFKEHTEFDFEMSSEDAEAGKFDDIGFQLDVCGQKSAIYIQAKHKEDGNNPVSWDDLLSTEKKAPFAICKYFNSFLDMPVSSVNEPPKFVLCTNIGLAKEVQESITEYTLDTKKAEVILKSICNVAYTIDVGKLMKDVRTKIKYYLTENSDLITLAKLLAQHVYKKETIDFRKPLVQKYRYVIEKKIATSNSKGPDCYEVDVDFFNENEKFKQAFEKEYRRLQTIWDDIEVKGIRHTKATPVENKDLEGSSEQNRNVDNLKDILDSDIAGLAKLLAKHIYDKTCVDFNNPLLRKYRHVIEKAIATAKSIGNECYEVNAKFIKDQNNFHKVFEKEYDILLKNKNHNIWESVQHKGIFFKKAKPATGKSKLSEQAEDDHKDESFKLYGTGKRDLPKQVEDHHIDTFFDMFIFIDNTKHKQDEVISSLLKTDLFPSEIKSPISFNIVYKNLAMLILDFMKEKCGKNLKKQQMDQLVEEIKLSLHFLKLQALSSCYCNEILNIRPRCKPGVVKKYKLFKMLEAWLSELPNEEECYFQQCSNLSLIVAVLEQLKDELHYIFLKHEWLENDQEIYKVFCAVKFSLVMVIDCRKDKINLDLIKSKIQHKQLKNHKMILILGLSRREFHQESFHQEEKILIGDLMEEDKKKMYELNKSTMLWGTTIDNRLLFQDGDNVDFVIHAHSFSSESEVKRNINEENFKKIEKYYIPRRWKQWDKDYAEEISSDDFWVRRLVYFSNALSEALDKTLENILKTSGSHTSANTSTFPDEYQEHIDPPGFLGETSPAKDGSSDECENVHSETKTHVILNESGSGKTHYMTWLARELQTRNTSWWVIKFNLSEYSTDFKKINESKPDLNDKLVVIRQLFQLVYLAFHALKNFETEMQVTRNKAQEIEKLISFSNSLVKLDETKINLLSTEQTIFLRMFANKFNSKELVLLMDGFDEVTPYYKTVVLEFLSNLESLEAVQKMYLSSRPYNFKNELQVAFNKCLFYRLVEFNIDDQCFYINRFLLENYPHESCDDQQRKHIFQVTYELLNRFQGNLIEIPLFLSMGLEVFLTIVKTHNDFKEKKIISPEIINECETQFELSNMIQSLVKQKLIIANIQKPGGNITDADTAAAKLLIGNEYARTNKTFSRLALYAICSHNEIKGLLSTRKQQEALEDMNKVKQGSEKTGIIEGVVDDIPIFIHRLFAEFFAALWFFNNQEDDKVKDFLKCNIYESADRQQIRYFLDRMICKEKPLHMAILDQSTTKMRSLLESNENLINSKDDWGRIPLHLALVYAVKENDDIVILLLDQTDKANFILKDTYFKRSLLDYAFTRDKLNGKDVYFEFYFVLKLLKQEASSNMDESFTIFRSEESKNFFENALPFVFHLCHALVPSIGNIRTTKIIEHLLRNGLSQHDLDLNIPIHSYKLVRMLESYNPKLAEKCTKKKN